MLTIGSLPVLGVVHMEVTAGDRTWSTGGSGDDAISVGQAFRDGERWLIDATDPNVEGVVAEVRLNQAVEGGDMALAGTLKIPEPEPGPSPASAPEGAMRVDLFDFELPEERIALRPASPRDAARLLVVRPGANPVLEDRGVRDLAGLLGPGDVMVFNDTKVIPARLDGRRIGTKAPAPTSR
jgi:hypothetical protein